jgi:hypothetical protein
LRVPSFGTKSPEFKAISLYVRWQIGHEDAAGDSVSSCKWQMLIRYNLHFEFLNFFIRN